MMSIVKECVVCGKATNIVVPEEGYARFCNGAFVQDALPELSEDDREMLVSGICPACWDKYFAEEADEDALEDVKSHATRVSSTDDYSFCTDDGFYTELARRLRDLEQFLVDTQRRSSHFSIAFMEDGNINVFNDYYKHGIKSSTNVSCLIGYSSIIVTSPTVHTIVLRNNKEAGA